MCDKRDYTWLERALADGLPVPNSVIRGWKKEEQRSRPTPHWEDLYFPEVDDDASNENDANTGSSRFGEEEENDEEGVNKVEREKSVEKDEHSKNTEDARNTARMSEKNPKDKVRTVTCNTKKQKNKCKKPEKKNNQGKTRQRKDPRAPEAQTKSSRKAKERNNTGSSVPTCDGKNKLKDGAVTSPPPSPSTSHKPRDASSKPKAQGHGAGPGGRQRQVDLASAIIYGVNLPEEQQSQLQRETNHGQQLCPRTSPWPSTDVHHVDSLPPIQPKGGQQVKVKPPPSRPEDTKEHWSIRLAKPKTRDQKQLDHNYSLMAYCRKFNGVDQQRAPRSNSTYYTTNIPRTRGLHFNFGFEIPCTSGATQPNRSLYRPLPFMKDLSTSPTLPKGCSVQPKRSTTNAHPAEDKRNK